MEQVTTLGIDLAKRVFGLHGVDSRSQVVLKRTVQRAELLRTIASLPPCQIGIEAGSGAHAWARQFQRFGHEVGIMAARLVTSYRSRGKNDGNDAEAICEAVSRPHMRFVPIKSEEQQALLSLHRVRKGFIEERTATINRIRGLLAELGVVLAQQASVVCREAVIVAEVLPLLARQAITDLHTHLMVLDARISAHDRQLNEQARLSEPAQRLMHIRGYHETLIAVAAKNARVAWAVLHNNAQFRQA